MFISTNFKKAIAFIISAVFMISSSIMTVYADDYVISVTQDTPKATTATLNFSVTNAIVDSVKLQYSADNSSGTEYKNDSTITITGLNQGTVYNYSAEVTYTPYDSSIPQTTATKMGTFNTISDSSLIINSMQVTADSSGTAADVTVKITATNCTVLDSSGITVDNAASVSNTNVTNSQITSKIGSLKTNTTYKVTVTVWYKGSDNKEYSVKQDTSYTHKASAPTTPTLVTKSISSIADNTATASISVSNYTSSMNITQAGIIVSTYSNRLTDEYVTSKQAFKFYTTKTTSWPVSISISGLEPNTTYYYKSYAIYDGKYYYESDYNSFKTLNRAPVVTTVSVTSITDTTATVAINVTSTGSSSVTKRGVVYSNTNSVPTISDSIISASTATTGSTSVSLTGLTKSKTYYVRAYVQNSYGTSYGAVKTFATSSSSNYPTVTTGSVSNVSDTSADIVINVTSIGGSTVTERGVVYSNSNSLPTTSHSKKTITGTTGSATVSIAGLTRNTTYYVRAYAINSYGTSYGDVNTFSTSSSIYTPTVTTGTITSITDTGATVGINVSSAGNSSVTERGVVYSLNSNPTISDSKKTVTGTTGSTTVSITGLTKSKTYYVRAYAKNSYGTSYGEVKTFSTGSSNYPTVVTGSVSNVSDTSADIIINVTSAGGNTVTERGVVYSNSSSTPTTSHSKKIIAGTTGSATVSIADLTRNKTYYVRVYAINSYGTSYGDVVTFSTSSSIYTPTVTTASITSITDTGATVGINVSSTGNSSVTERGVVYSLNSNPTISDSKKTVTGTTGSTTVSITGLTKSKTYYVRAYAKNSYGTSYGEIKNFTTSTNSSIPAVTTNSVGEITGKTAEVTMNVTSKGSSDVIERGFVYSVSNNTPTVGSTNCTKQIVFGTTGSVTFMLDELDSNKTYYVSAYARNSSGYGYGEVLQFTTKSSVTTPYVTTSSVDIKNNTSMDVDINVTSDNGYSITERGVVYSTTSTSPKRGVSNSSTVKDGTSKTGRSNIELTDLSSSTYYVRAYATNKYGTGYGQVVQVIMDRNLIVTNAASNVTTNSATVGGNVSQTINSSVVERGVVYSNTNSTPTINDKYEKSTVTTYGNFSIGIKNLLPDQTYYVRAYIKTSSGYSYGSTVQFSTSGNAYITILYVLPDGANVSSQSINARQGVTIDANSLDVPYGYYLEDGGFSYTSTGHSATVQVTVINASVNSQFMESSSNNKFEPDRKATRVEVAKMIYALRGKPYVSSSKIYTDINRNYSEKAAIDYVSAMNFMTGYTDGSFKPNNNITRAEVAVICTTVYNIEPDDGYCPFSDSNSHWARTFITAASNYGSIFGYPNGTFKPNNNITRAEICSLFSNAEKRDLTPLGYSNFSDVPSSHWAYDYIMNAAIPSR